MSKVYNRTEIDGDLAVGRKVVAGGELEVKGKGRSVIEGSLKVEGFFDAPNIKGAVKGLFATEEELKREYPNPRPGWCAIVLADKESGFLYLAKNIEWEKQSEEAKPFDFIADSINVFASKGELGDLENKVNANADDIYHLKYGMDFRLEGEAVELMLHQRPGDSPIPLALLPSADGSFAGVMSAEDKRNLNNSTVKVITWNNDTDPSNMNDFVVAGVYDIKGEHTRKDDNLPVLNTGGGHTFNARLTVLDSSIPGDGKNDDKCITQVLSFSNRLGQGEVYIRTGKGKTIDNITWDNWSTLQRNVNVVSVESLDDLIDNGIYSGVLNPTGETFVLVVINNYALASKYGIERSISQFKYSVSHSGNISFKKRVKKGNESWGNWHIINSEEVNSLLEHTYDESTQYTDTAVKDIKNRAIEYSNTGAHKDKFDIYYRQLSESQTKAISIPSATTSTAGVMSAEDKVKLNNSYKDIDVSPNEIDVELDIEDNAENTHHVVIPAATAEKAGVMSSEDKVSLDSIPNEIDKIKDGDTIVAQAREIHSRNGKTVPDSFIVRTTAGSGTIGDGVASLKSVGGNIVKHLVDGTFTSGWSGPLVKIGDGVAVITPRQNYDFSRYKDVSCVANHKYYIKVSTYTPASSSHYIAILGYGDTIKTITTMYRKPPREQWGDVTYIFTAPAEYSTLGLSISADANTGVIAAAKPYFIDLTEMFGAGNEPDQVTCDRLFGAMDALPQGLTVANPTEFKSTGFNQFNPENVLEGKAIVDNAIVSGDKKIAVIPCLPCKVGVGENNGYCIHGEFGEDIKVYLTPLNPMEVDGELYMHELTKDATTDTYVPLIKGYMLVEVPTTANLCAHFLWSEDKCERDSYEPYFESKVELPTIPQMSEYGLAGIQSSGTLACDEIDFERGVYVKRIEKIDWNTVDIGYTKYGDILVFMLKNTGCKNVSGYAPSNAISDKYSQVNRGSVNSTNMKSGDMMLNVDIIFIYDTNYTSIDAFRAALQGTMLYYELAEPEEYPLPKVDNNYISSDYGVEQFDSVVPCNANNLYYMRSLAGETRNFLDRLMAGLGTSDATVVADRILAVVNPAVEPANVEPEIPIEE